MPPTSIDGTDITGATIDGQDVEEITVDGQTVFSAVPDIPDSGNLQARYDATQFSLNDGDTVSTWPDETGNGNDLTASGGPTYKTNIINGNPIVRFDGIDDLLDTTWTELTQPWQVLVVAKLRNPSSGSNEGLFGSAAADEVAFFSNVNDKFVFRDSNGAITGSNDDGFAHIINTFANSTNSEFRIDGVQDATGTLVANLDGFTVGDRGNNDIAGEWDVGEVLVYNTDLSDTDENSAEGFLSNKWGIAI